MIKKIELELSLHTAYPGESGEEQTNGEANYEGYARVPARFTVSDELPKRLEKFYSIPFADFPQCTKNPPKPFYQEVSHGAVGLAGKVVWTFTITPCINVCALVTPRVYIGD